MEPRGLQNAVRGTMTSDRCGWRSLVVGNGMCGNIKVGEAIRTLDPCLTCDYDVACTDLFVTEPMSCKSRYCYIVKEA